jgi:hypothetical protein
MMHVWPILVALPEARAAIAEMAALLDGGSRRMTR